MQGHDYHKNNQMSSGHPLFAGQAADDEFDLEANLLELSRISIGIQL